MRKRATILLSLIIIMAVIPIAANLDHFSFGIHSQQNENASVSVLSDISNQSYSPPENINFINKSDGKEISRSVKSLLRSLIGAVVDSDFLEHEVKSLTVAYHTQICFNNENKNLCIDTSNNNIYLSEQDLKSKFDAEFTTFCSYIDNVYNCLVITDGKPTNLNISTFFSNNVENTNIPFTANPYNSLNSNYITLISYDTEEFTDKIHSLKTEADISEPKNTVGEIKYDKNGDVKILTIGGIELRGDAVADFFSLPTKRYTLVYSKDKFTFTVMQHDSLNTLIPETARKMSEQSNTYQEIINYYFGKHTI